MNDITPVSAVKLRLNPSIGDRPAYLGLQVVLFDLHLHATLGDARQIRMAKKIADEHGVEFIVFAGAGEAVRKAIPSWDGKEIGSVEEQP